jgi:hypothetical protein
LKYGYKPEAISQLNRWDKIELLRRIANEKQNDDEELQKYARQLRFTTKMQREKYQRDINGLFMTMVENLGKQESNDITSDDEGEFELAIEKMVEKELVETMAKKPKGDEPKEFDANDMFDSDED